MLPPMMTPSPQTLIKSTSSPQVPVSPGKSNDSIKKPVTRPDNCCIVTGVVEQMCILSHIIPKALIQVQSTFSQG